MSSASLLSNHQFDLLMDKLSILTNSVTELNNKFSTQSQMLENCMKDVSALRDENNLLREKVSSLEKLVNSTTPSQDDIYYETTQRLKREKNVLLLGVPERSPEDDARIIKEVITHLSPNSANCIQSGYRLGKNTNNNKPRLYRVIFGTPKAALDVLRNKKNISRNLYPSVKIISDMTPKQRQHLNDLRAELELRLKTETNLTIKYVYGVPQIVQILSNKRVREEESSPNRESGLKVVKPASSKSE